MKVLYLVGAILLISVIVSCLLYFSGTLGPYGSVLGPCFSLISIIIVIVGWGVVFSNALRCSTRSETHTLVSNLFSRCDALESSGHNYWTSESNAISPEKAASQTIVFLSQIDSIRQLVDILELRNIKIDDVSEAFTRLRTSLVLDAERPQQVPSINRRRRIGEISQSIRSLTKGVYRSFLREHPSVF